MTTFTRIAQRTLLASLGCAALSTASNPAVAHEGGGDGEHLNVGFYYGHNGDFETPANPPQPATLLVDTHPWELDTVFYTLEETAGPLLNGWTSEFPGYRSLLPDDQEFGGHGYFSWLDPSHSINSPDLRLHLVNKSPELTIIDPGTNAEMTSPHVIGTNTANHHLIYYVDQNTGLGPNDVVTAEFYLTDANVDGLEQSENFTLQFRVVPEPTSALLLGLGGLLVARRRRSQH